MRWFDGNRRDLPWRGTRDPWAVLVSEVMLQQTTVAAVTPYYERFLARWPTPADLAVAETDELLSAWAGLGYYRRAHMLKDAAAVLADEVPGDAAGWRALPGVGDYTAAAVASIAFDEPVAAVDGNVERVVSRLWAIAGDPRKAAGKRAVREAAQALLDPERPGDANQAAMELGATVCKPRNPDCPRCPLRSGCRALALGEPTRFPELPARAKTTPVARLAAVVVARGKVLLARRDEAPNAGFLELPHVDLPSEHVDASGAPRAAAGDLGARLATHLRDAHGLVVRVGEPLPPHRHAITRWRIRVHPFRCSLSSGRVAAPLAWTSPRDGRPTTTATRRILAASLPELFRTESPAP